ncbi:MAG: glycoside hydrolase family 13, partial [Fervidobacterium sp.]
MRIRVLIMLVLIISILSFSSVTYKDGKVVFTFKTDINANVVYLAGSFNNWSPTSWPMKLVDGVWTYEVELKPGSYQYKYVIDGKNWKEDPEAPAFVDDGFGGKNGAFTLTDDGKILGLDGSEKKSDEVKKYELNLNRENTIFVDPDNYVVIRFFSKEAKYVFIAGTFNNWSDKDTECYYIEDGWWEAVLELNPGIYEYKFVVDGNWVVDPNAFAYTDDGFGGKNGVFELVKEGGKFVVQAPKSATSQVGKTESVGEKTEQKVESEKSTTGV